MALMLELTALMLAVVLTVSLIGRQRAAAASRAASERSLRYRQAFMDLLRGDYTELDDMLSRLMRCVRETLAVERVSLWLYDEQRTAILRRALVVRDASRPVGPSRLSGAEYPDYFAALSQAFVIDASDARVDPRTREFAHQYLNPLNIGAMLDVPLRKFGAHIGLLCIEHEGSARVWSREDQVFATAVAGQLTLCFEHAELHRAREALLNRTLHDADTGLPNLVLLRDRLHHALERGGTVALLLIQLPRFRLIVASRGRAYADALVRVAAERLRLLVGEGRTLARTGREEFALLLSEATQAQAADGWARRVQHAFDEPLVLAGESFRVPLTIGYSLHQGASISADTLISEASAAMRIAMVGSARAFDPELRVQAQRRVELEQALRVALERQEFETWLQPVVDVESAQVVTLEALLRWRHPTLGVLAPGDFLQEAIDSGLILPIGRQAIAHAIAVLGEARRTLADVDLRLAINLAGPELLDEDLQAFLLECADRHQLPLDRLIVEVTETALVTHLDRAQRTLEHLRAAGASICMDDFGTGFSSLVWLKRFPITAIKIDGAFVRGMGYDPRDEAIVQAVCDLAGKLQQEVVAEGVENQEQLDRLRAMGVRYVQGYWFAEPFPAAELSRARLQQALAPLSPQPLPS